MSTRVNILETQPEVYKAMMGLEKFIASTALDPIHKELIKIRASQINGCAFCIDMHTKEARKLGLTEQRMHLLNAWKEVNLYTDKEKAVLAMTEEITLIQKHHVSQETYDQAKSFFDDQYIIAIIMMVITINAWNRIAISTEMQPAS